MSNRKLSIDRNQICDICNKKKLRIVVIDCPMDMANVCSDCLDDVMANGW